MSDGTIIGGMNNLCPRANRRRLLRRRLRCCHLRTGFVKARGHLWDDNWRRWSLCEKVCGKGQPTQADGNYDNATTHCQTLVHERPQ
jgi:hypothetical protein